MSEESYEAGLDFRRQMLGDADADADVDADVDAAIAITIADDFTASLQRYLTEHAWGATWAREGLPLKTRGMLNLAMLTAINRPHGLKIHLRATCVSAAVATQRTSHTFI